MRPMNTVAETLTLAARTLAQHSESPRLDAEVLLGSVLGIGRAALIVRGAQPIAGEALQLYQGLLDRRVAGTPVAYLTGTREFWSLPLKVTPAVLVPRPETETLVELALQRLPPDQERSVLDLGTGSGAVALAIAAERPRAQVTGADISPAALGRGQGQLARPRAAAGRLAPRILVRCAYAASASIWWLPIRPMSRPQIPRSRSWLPNPSSRFSGGPTGLEALASIAAGAAAHLKAGGWLLLEHGSTQGPDVALLLERHGFSGVQTHHDYSGTTPRYAGNHSLTTSGTSMIRFETTLGDFTIELFEKEAPETVVNFLQYIDDGFFDGTIFHRIVPGFVIQGGGFTEDMTQKRTQPPIKNEADNGVKNTRGTLSMARTNDINSATSQFFVNLKDNDFLDHKRGNFGYAVFARVTPAWTSSTRSRRSRPAGAAVSTTCRSRRSS